MVGPELGDARVIRLSLSCEMHGLKCWARAGKRGGQKVEIELLRPYLKPFVHQTG
jgi:hypothetical protein